MASLKFSWRLSGRVNGVIDISATLILILLFSRFVDGPEVHAVTHAVLQSVTVQNDQTPSGSAGADLNSILTNKKTQQGELITLPFLRARGEHTELVKFIYSITLDEKTLGANRALLDTDAHTKQDTFGLLFIQIVNGGDFYLNGEWVAGLAQSTRAERWRWYEPFVVPLPSHLLRTDGTPNVLTVSQSTQEPYISISRLYFGHIDELDMVHCVVYFFCSTLANALKALCLAAGLFLLAMWAVSPEERIYAVAGGVCILWAVMFIVFRLQQSSSDMREVWRWSVYASQGGAISLMTVFILSFIDRTPGMWAKCVIFGVSGIAPIVYAAGGRATEPYLDLVWSPAAIMLYAYATAQLIGYWWKTRSLPACLFLLQSIWFLILAFHDYAVQVRLVDKLSDSGLEAGWNGLLFEHIPARFLGMPTLLMIAGYMLLVRYRDKVIALEYSKEVFEQREAELAAIHCKRELTATTDATLLERERIYQDIHDGIGSQLVKAIFSLRHPGSDSSKVVQNLQACLQDLRLVIDAQPGAQVDIQTTVFAFCVTQELDLEGSGLAISYHVGPESTVYADPKVNLNVLRVLQESLSNTLRHSGAKTIDVKLEAGKSHLTLAITDDGNGHRRSATQILAQQAAYGSSGSRGITGLALRAADIGATYTINIAESGTKVHLSIPLPADMKVNSVRQTEPENNVVR